MRISRTAELRLAVERPCQGQIAIGGDAWLLTELLGEAGMQLRIVKPSRRLQLGPSLADLPHDHKSDPADPVPDHLGHDRPQALGLPTERVGLLQRSRQLTAHVIATPRPEQRRETQIGTM